MNKGLGLKALTASVPGVEGRCPHPAHGLAILKFDALEAPTWERPEPGEVNQTPIRVPSRANCKPDLGYRTGQDQPWDFTPAVLRCSDSTLLMVGSRISVRTLLMPAPLRSGEYDVEAEEAHHALHVLRLRVGDAVRVADGAGSAATAQVLTAARTLRLAVGPIEDLPPDRLAGLTVAVAPPKGDRWTDLVRGLTELGVGAIEPLRCARGERVPADLGRTRRVAAEALKQCRRATLPRIGPPIGIDGLAARGGRVIVCDRSGGPPSPGQPAPVTIVIGPEGGLEDAEIATLVAAGAVRVRLAGAVLRIETAALAATAVWAASWEHVRP